jgi:Tfp pilus assembly protein PilF
LLGEVLTLDPSYFDAHRVLGVAAELDGNMEEAARQFRTAIEGDPSLSEAHVDLGLVLLRTGHAKEAQAEMLSALLPPCEDPGPTLIRELTALRDPKVEQAYEQAVRAQAERQRQYALIAILNKRSPGGSPAAGQKP